jgi:hypothetical protein
MPLPGPQTTMHEPNDAPPPPPLAATVDRDEVVPTDEFLQVASYIRNLLIGVPSTFDQDQALQNSISNLHSNHPLVLAQLLVTSPVSDHNVSIACSKLFTLCRTFATVSNNACTNLLYILYAVVCELRQGKRYSTLYKIAFEATSLCLDILESTSERNRNNAAIQLLQSQILGYQCDAKLLIKYASRLKGLVEKSLQTTETRNDSINQKLGKMVQCCLFLHSKVLTPRERGQIMYDNVDDDDSDLSLLSTSSYTLLNNERMHFSEYTRILSNECWSSSIYDKKVQEIKERQDNENNQESQESQENQENQKKFKMHKEQTLTVDTLPLWMEGHYETDTQKRITIQSIGSTNCIHFRTQSDTVKVDLIGYDGCQTLVPPTLTKDWHFQGLMWTDKITKQEKIEKPNQFQEWTCDDCTMRNKGASTKCEVCGKKAPERSVSVIKGNAPDVVLGRFASSNTMCKNLFFHFPPFYLYFINYFIIIIYYYKLHS